MVSDGEKGAWSVRGVPKALRDALAKRAQDEGRNVGFLVAEALAAWLKRPAEPELAERVSRLERELAELRRKVGALAAGAERQATSRPARQASPGQSAARAGGRTQETPREKVAEVMRLRHDGLTHAAIATRVGLSKPGVGKIVRREEERARQAAAEPDR